MPKAIRWLTRVAWIDVEKTLLIRLAVIALIGAGVFGVRAFAQSTAPPQVIVQEAPSAPFLTETTRDPWFQLLLGYVVFCAIVSGMPEPDEKSGPGYIWAYRSGHLLAMMGTSYFQNKHLWPTEEQMKVMMGKEGK